MTAAPTAGDALALVRLAASGAAGALARHASRIDDINVFPVPDGDTGTNLSQTARSVLERSQATRARAAAIARVGRARRAAGRARQLGDHPLAARAGRLRPPRRGRPPRRRRGRRALRRASTEADAALRVPVEGTILTVARALAAAPRRRARTIVATLAAGLARARRRSRARPTCCRRCARRASSTRAAPGSSSSCAARSRAARRAGAGAVPRWIPPARARHGRLRRAPLLHGFLVTGAFPRERLEARLAALGDCARRRLRRRSCARTSTPTIPARTRGGDGARALSGVEISDMHVQRDALAERTAAPMAALDDDGRLATSSQSSMATATACSMRASGARPCWPDGRPPWSCSRRSPSPAAGSSSSRTTRSAACRGDAARAAAVAVHVVPTHGLAQGLAALVAYRTDQSAAVLGGACEAAAAWAGSGEVAAGADDAAALREAARRALATGATLVTVLAGATAEQQALERSRPWLASAHPGGRVELHAGGQAHPRCSGER